MGDAYSENAAVSQEWAVGVCLACGQDMGVHYHTGDGKAICPQAAAKPKHKAANRFRRRAGSPYVLQPGAVYQIPGTKVGVKNVMDFKVVLIPVEFDKLRV